jgi:hypothetical protein
MNGAQFSEIETRQQRKTFAHTLDATSYILRDLGFPVHKLRDAVDGLQGAGGGREAFDLSHFALARRLRHTGDAKTAEAYARRKVAALDTAQRKAGRLLFTIERGGGIEHKRTHYVDHITPAANWMMQQARASDLWAKHPAQAIEAFTAAAVEMLPRATEEAPGEHEAMQIEDDLYIQRMLNQGINCMLRACDRAALAGRDDEAIEEMAIERMRRYLRDHRATRPKPAAPVEGLQKCKPSVKNPKKNDEVSEMCAAAQALAARGFRVFPLHGVTADGGCTCDKGAACSSPGKHPRFSLWQELANNDPKRVAHWFKRKQWLNSNVGILTGAKAGVLVIDIDPRHGGDETLQELVTMYGALPETLVAATGGGGMHIFYTLPEGVKLRNSKALGKGIDVRGEGGLVVGVGSMHASGRPYEWLTDVEIAPLPELLLTLLTTERGKATGAADTKARVQAKSGAGTGHTIAEGNRNAELFRIACGERGRGESEDTILQILIDANARRCSPPLPERELEKIARSAMRYQPNAAAVA